MSASLFERFSGTRRGSAAEVTAGRRVAPGEHRSTTGCSCTPTACDRRCIKATDKTPSSLIGPYFNHPGRPAPAGRRETRAIDPIGPSTGPRTAPRLHQGRQPDEEAGHVHDGRPRGFGGSTGCLELVRPGEQSEVSGRRVGRQDSRVDRPGRHVRQSVRRATGLSGVDKHPAARRGRRAGDGLRRYRYSTATACAARRGRDAGAIRRHRRRPARPPTWRPTRTKTSTGQRHDSARLPRRNWPNTQSDDHYRTFWRQRNLIRRRSGSNVRSPNAGPDREQTRSPTSRRSCRTTPAPMRGGSARGAVRGKRGSAHGPVDGL